MRDYWVRAMDARGHLRLCVIHLRDTVQRARDLHNCSPTATASMMGSEIKNPAGSLTLKIDGGGPLGALLCVSDSLGRVRGYAENPGADLPPRGDGKLDVGGLVGREGYIQVIRDLGMGEPYLGRVSLRSGEIAEDVTGYFAQSEQLPTVCALGVRVSRDYSVLSAGGLLLQVLPGAPEDIFDQVEARIAGMRPVSELLESGMTPEDIALTLLPGLDMRLLPGGRGEVSYDCKCSRARVAAALRSMGRAELHPLALEQEGREVEITCQFCDKVYYFTSKELAGMADTL